MTRAWCVAAVLLSCLALGGSARAQTAADVAAARELFNEGSLLAKEGAWDAARDRYQRAYDLSREPIALYSLGVAQKQTGQLVEALESFRRFLKVQTSPKTEVYLEPARAAVTELEGQVATISVAVTPSDVEGLALVVSGVAVPPAAFGRARLVNPGLVEVTARAPGYQEATQHFTLVPGEKKDVTIGLVAAPEGDVAAPITPLAEPDRAPAEKEPSGRSLVLPVALIGGGAAVFGAGVVVGLVGVGKAEDAPTRDGPEADDARTLALVGDIVAGVGLATACVGGALLVFGGDDETTASSEPTRVHVGVGGVTVRGSF